MLRKLKLRQKHGFVINKRVVRFQLQIHFELSASKNTLLETKQVRSTKKLFHYKCLLFYFISLLKILNWKTLVSEKTIGFNVQIATILSYIKPRSTTRISLIGYLIPRHLLQFTNDL